MTPPDELLPMIAQRFAALSDVTRLRLILRLRAGESGVNALSEQLDIAQPLVSKHLTILRTSGLVTCRRDGRRILYRICDGRLEELCGLVCQSVIEALQREQAPLQAFLRSREGAAGHRTPSDSTTR